MQETLSAAQAACGSVFCCRRPSDNKPGANMFRHRRMVDATMAAVGLAGGIGVNPQTYGSEKSMGVVSLTAEQATRERQGRSS